GDKKRERWHCEPETKLDHLASSTPCRDAIRSTESARVYHAHRRRGCHTRDSARVAGAASELLRIASGLLPGHSKPSECSGLAPPPTDAQVIAGDHSGYCRDGYRCIHPQEALVKKLLLAGIAVSMVYTIAARAADDDPPPPPSRFRPWQQVWQCNDIRVTVTARDPFSIEYDLGGTIWGGGHFTVIKGALYFNERPCLPLQPVGY